MPSISIAMCTYNGEHLVKAQLDSILAQTRPPGEMVICDDGSSDGTVPILQNFAGSAPFPVRVIVNRENLGATDNYQQAMRLCRGDIIAFADQDDVWLPEKLEKVEAVFMETPDLGAVFSDAHVVDEGLRPLGYTLWQSIRFNEYERCLARSGQALDVLMRYNIASGATMAFNARVYRDLVLPIPSGCLGDHWMAILCAAIGQLGMIEEPIIHYRKHPAQMIGPKGGGSIFSVIAGEIYKSMRAKCYLREFRRVRSQELCRDWTLYTRAYDRLMKAGMMSGRPEVRKMFEGKLAHVELRRQMCIKSHAGRLKPVLAEVYRSGYRRYSNGISYVLGDLLI